MLYADGAKYDPFKQCLSGTREPVIDEIIQWANDADDPHSIFLLSGVAGSGKSTIAHTVAGYFDQLNRLGASFCFDINAHQAEQRLNYIFSTIGTDLANFDPVIKTSLKNAVQKRGLRKTTHLPEQFESFILKPVESLTHTIGPILVVIDALDESGDQDHRENLLKVLARKLPELPFNFRFLITTA